MDAARAMKYHTITQPSEKDWSPWNTPALKYKLACCDCGLVHDIEFCVRLKGGKMLDRRKGQIKFRVRRNVRATAAMRRGKHA
jgi:hypothetical protein